MPSCQVQTLVGRPWPLPRLNGEVVNTISKYVQRPEIGYTEYAQICKRCDSQSQSFIGNYYHVGRVVVEYCSNNRVYLECRIKTNVSGKQEMGKCLCYVSDLSRRRKISKHRIHGFLSICACTQHNPITSGLKRNLKIRHYAELDKNRQESIFRQTNYVALLRQTLMTSQSSSVQMCMTALTLSPE